ncbi:hypothetical protein [Leucothrix pacifica]|uniref:Uncharacterized protein n=1 Tax=Leucothrix pacifica TaxID=1247513 RepID=A0A317CRY8_9GAMM|nr:hypothetical protein [Leucothrix pacifica]PWQ99082.1 hypothetical protein DKW60_06480 [Leucothrix pacifica]
MGAFFRQIFLLVWLAGFIYSLVSIAEHWDYDINPPDIEQMLAQRVEPAVLQQSVEDALRAEEYDEARSLLAIGKRYNHALDYPAYENYLLKHDTTGARLTKNVSGFAEGFLSGKGADMSGVAGALAADFTVVGDVRDLSEQYSRYQQGLPVNQLITSLAGVGVGLTAASIGSLGAAAPVKAGASTLKLATRMNRLSRSFRDELTVMAGKVFDWQQFLRQSKNADLSSISRIAKQAYNPQAARQISALAEQANGIRKNTSVADSIHLLQYVDNTADLNRVHRVTERYGIHTRGVFRLLGKGAIRGVKALRITLELLISITSSLFFALLFIVTIGGDKKKTEEVT